MTTTKGICPYCGTALEAIEFNGIAVAYRPCSCDKAVKEERLREQDRIAKERHEKEQAFRQKLKASGIRSRFIDAEADCTQYLDALRRGSGLYIVGGVGVGKTYLASAIAIELIRRKWRVKVSSSLEMLTAFRGVYGTSSSEGELQKGMLSCDALVIDDLGKEQASEWVLSVLFGLVNGCYEAMKPQLIITSQYQRSELVERYTRKSGDEATARAIVSRLTEMCRKVELKGGDRRLVQKLNLEDGG